MQLGFIGSGLKGAELGTVFARAENDVVFSYVRSEQEALMCKRGRQGRGAGRHTGKVTLEAGT
jgi:hypothetical protein